MGIVTDRDLREKVVARGRSVDDPVRDIMSLPLVRVDVKDYCFEAVLKMIKHNIHHILVIKEGQLKGVLTNHDLMLLQGTSPLSFAKDLESQESIEGLVPVSVKINRVVGLLLKEGARASNITRIITELNDRLVRKVLEIAEKKFGRPPVPFCWISFGSEGRKEQTFKTDQDNAIIYADPATPEQEERAKAYFAEFALFVRDSLVKCGFPLCPADYMASNPRWCQPLKAWKNYFSSWITHPTPEAILRSLIFFDFRPLYCGEELAEELRELPDGPAGRPQPVPCPDGGGHHQEQAAPRIFQDLSRGEGRRAQGRAEPEAPGHRAAGGHRPALRARDRGAGDLHAGAHRGHEGEAPDHGFHGR